MAVHHGISISVDMGAGGILERLVVEFAPLAASMAVGFDALAASWVAQRVARGVRRTF
jgi:hypothetical protein